MVGDNEGKLGKCTHEKEYDKRIGKGYEESRDGIVCQRPLLGAAPVDVAGWIGLETIDTEEQQYSATANLKPELIGRIGYQVHDKTHTKAR